MATMPILLAFPAPRLACCSLLCLAAAEREGGLLLGIERVTLAKKLSPTPTAVAVTERLTTVLLWPAVLLPRTPLRLTGNGQGIRKEMKLPRRFEFEKPINSGKIKYAAKFRVNLQCNGSLC